MDQLKRTAEQIRTMEVRGAANIGRVAAQALKAAALESKAPTLDAFREEMRAAGKALVETRPTAVSLPNAVSYVLACKADSLERARLEVAERADAFVEHSLGAVAQIAAIGARHVSPGSTLMTHCNSSAALAVIEEAHRQGRVGRVVCTESRPRWQGYLTAKELNQHRIPTTIIVDSAVRFHMKNVDMVVVGADAVTAQGNVVNKIGTSQLALAAYEARVPVMVAAETYKFSPRTIAGDLVEIEERSPDEVWPGQERAMLGYVDISNPSFDVTPERHVDVIVTEVGAIPPAMAFYLMREYMGWGLEGHG